MTAALLRLYVATSDILPGGLIKRSCLIRRILARSRAMILTPYCASLPASDNEYFIIENRCQQGIDAYCPACGLAIYHCDTKGSNEYQDGSPGKHYQCALIQADGKNHLEKNQNMGDSATCIRMSAGPVWPPNYGTRQIPGLIIREIGPAGQTMSFRVG